MTQAQVDKYLADAQAITKKATVSKASARRFLVDAGFLTPKGNLKKIYR